MLKALVFIASGLWKSRLSSGCSIIMTSARICLPFLDCTSAACIGKQVLLSLVSRMWHIAQIPLPPQVFLPAQTALPSRHGMPCWLCIAVLLQASCALLSLRPWDCGCLQGLSPASLLIFA